MASLRQWRPNRFAARRARAAFRALEESLLSETEVTAPPMASGPILAAAAALLELCPVDTPVRTVLQQALAQWPASPLQTQLLRKLRADLQSVQSGLLDCNCGDLLYFIHAHMAKERRQREQATANRDDVSAHEFDAAMVQILSEHEGRLYWLLKRNGEMSERLAIQEVYGHPDYPEAAYVVLQNRLDNLQARLNRKLSAIGLPTVYRPRRNILALIAPK
jgi:hypothetical protein